MPHSRVFLLLVFLSVACHGPALAQKRLGASAIRQFFRDTALITVTRFQAREFDLQISAQRDSLRATIKRERDLWRAQAPRNYRFLINVACFCPGPRGWQLMEVRSGQPLKAWDGAGKAASLTDWNTVSIDQMFDNLEKSAGRDGMMRVGFDPTWHYPTYAYTSAARVPDSWGVFEARALRPI